jgi:cysteine synthase A
MSTDPNFPATENLGIAVYSNNAEAIGNTPLFVSIVYYRWRNSLSKIESRNPAFSVKDRIGAALIADAEAKGF